MVTTVVTMTVMMMAMLTATWYGSGVGGETASSGHLPSGGDHLIPGGRDGEGSRSLGLCHQCLVPSVPPQAEPWIFKKWFGRSAPEDGDEEPTDVPEVPPAATEVKKSREKKLEKKEEKTREGRAAQAERSSRREARAKDRAPGDKPSRAPRAPREPEEQPQKKRGREGKESRRERDEPRKEGWKGRPGRVNGGRESPKRDWRQQKGRKPWEPVAAPGKDGTARPREGKRRD